MGWESILGFIIIIFINSLFSQNKKQSQANKRKNQQGNTQPRPIQTKPQQAGTRQQPTASARPVTEQTARKPKSVLEQMFQELQRELTGNGTQQEVKREMPPVIEAPPPEQNISYENQKGDFEAMPVPQTLTSFKEPKRAGNNLFANRNQIVKGVIMAEVLGKPKALR